MTLAPFCKLRDPEKYVACRHDMRVDSEHRDYWVSFFKQHLETILALGIESAVARGESDQSAHARAAACRVEFNARFDGFAKDPSGEAPVTILTMDQWRDSVLHRHGFPDAFFDLKNRENEKVIHLLPQVCAQLDALDGDAEQFRAVVENVFAGNIFDMGAAGSAKLLLDGKLDFFSTRKRLPDRPWLIDDFDAFERRTSSAAPWKKCVFFIDNAGADFLLGAIPFMRWLARRGTQVILAANERPTLNDMTVHDVRRWWPRVLEVEPSLSALPIRIVSTGTGEPLIDLMRVSAELNDAAGDADLVILEGMGRGVESNLEAEFNCDAANLAMIKDHMIAKGLNGKLYDVVCKFR